MNAGHEEIEDPEELKFAAKINVALSGARAARIIL
jgi:hypothetical protein